MGRRVSEAAAELDRMRWFSGELFFPPFDPSREAPPVRVLTAAGDLAALATWAAPELLHPSVVLG